MRSIFLFNFTFQKLHKVNTSFAEKDFVLFTNNLSYFSNEVGTFVGVQHLPDEFLMVETSKGKIIVHTSVMERSKNKTLYSNDFQLLSKDFHPLMSHETSGLCSSEQRFIRQAFTVSIAISMVSIVLSLINNSF